MESSNKFFYPNYVEYAAAIYAGLSASGSFLYFSLHNALMPVACLALLLCLIYMDKPFLYLLKCKKASFFLLAFFIALGSVFPIALMSLSASPFSELLSRLSLLMGALGTYAVVWFTYKTEDLVKQGWRAKPGSE